MYLFIDEVVELSICISAPPVILCSMAPLAGVYWLVRVNVLLNI